MEWQEHRSPEGRLYWFNAKSQESVWEKPDALKTPRDKALDSTSWKQYESNGKSYYVHKETQETTWDQPEEVAKALASIPSAPAPAPASNPTPLPIGPPPASARPHSNSPAPAFVPQQQQNLSMGPGGGALVGMGFNGPGGGGFNNSNATGPQSAPQAVQAQPDYALWASDPEAAVAAFKDLLRQTGVTPDWTWEQTMRTIITAPAYKALKTTDQRRAALEDYQAELVKAAREKRQAALERIRPAWREALGRASEMGMKSWWPWGKTRQLLQTEFNDVWRTARDDADRQELWQDYVDELKTKEVKREKETHERNLDKLNRMLDGMDLDERTTWREVRRSIERSKEFSNDPELQQTFDPNDLLNLFETRMDQVEAAVVEQRKKSREEKRRRVRKHREAFVALLEDLRDEGVLQYGTTWPDVWPRLKDDERLHNMLGNPGSTPLELFWDVVDELDERVEEHCRVIEGAFAQQHIQLDLNTTWEQFQDHLKTEGVDTRVRHIDERARQNAYAMIHDRFAQLAAEEQRRAEKKLRNAIDDLRYAIRDLDPVVDLESSYEAAQPRLEELKEYKALPDEASRRAAFDKYIARAKERKEAKEAEEREWAEREAERKARRDARAARDRSEYEDSPRRSGGGGRERERERERQSSSRHHQHHQPHASSRRSVSASVHPEDDDVDMSAASSSSRRPERKRTVSPHARDSDRGAPRPRRDERARYNDDRHSSNAAATTRRERPPSRERRDRESTTTTTATTSTRPAAAGRPRPPTPDAGLGYGSPDDDEGDVQNKKRKGETKEKEESRKSRRTEG